MNRKLLTMASCIMVSSVLVGCKTTDVQKTFNKAVGRASFAPATYGTDALLEVIEDPDHSKADAVAAATQLSSRALTDAHCTRLVSALKNQMSEKVEVAVLKTIAAQQMDESLKDLISFFPTAVGPESSAEAASVIMTFLPSDNHRFGFMAKYGIRSVQPNVRARAAKYLASFGERSVPIWISALKTETSASAALAMCEGLHKFGGNDAFPPLQTIQNDVERIFKTDAHLGEEKVTSDMVRAAAVKAVEDLRAGR